MEDDTDLSNPDDDLEGGRSKCQCCQCWIACYQCWNSSIFLKRFKKCFTFVFTNVGLILVVICYCLFGAVLFEVLEAKNEIEVKRSISTIREDILDSMWSEINELRVFNESKWTEDITDKLREFERHLIKEGFGMISKSYRKR